MPLWFAGFASHFSGLRWPEPFVWCYHLILVILGAQAASENTVALRLSGSVAKAGPFVCLLVLHSGAEKRDIKCVHHAPFPKSPQAIQQTLASASILEFKFSKKYIPQNSSLSDSNMKTFSICTAMAILAATFSHAAPVELETRQFFAQVTFQGAPPDVAFYTRSIPTDGSVFYLSTSTWFWFYIPLLFVFLFQHSSPLSLYGQPASLKNPFLPNILRLDDPLSISHIKSLGGATCTFYGIDGSVTTVVGAQTVDVGPPQTQLRAVCRAL